MVLVKLTRLDGLVLRLTSWDKPVVHDGETWDPSDGIQLSAIQATAGGAADDVEATGLLTDDGISEQDLTYLGISYHHDGRSREAGATLLARVCAAIFLTVVLSRRFGQRLQK